MPKKKSNKKKGMDFESKVQKSINSGSPWFSKGDLSTDEYVIECKYTGKKGFRITSQILNKLWNEALSANKLPMLVIGIENEDGKWLLKIDIEKK